MNLSTQLAKHVREVHFGGNWTSVNLADTLKDLSWKQATTRLHELNTIAMLVYHINYYVVAISGVLEGRPLEAKDKFSFDLPPVNSEEDWQHLVDKVLSDAAHLVTLIGQLPEEKLPEIFAEEKYGSYLRNIMGVCEHTHYHLGQIVLLKKLQSFT
jgi:hypothetical protein